MATGTGTNEDPVPVPSDRSSSSSSSRSEEDPGAGGDCIVANETTNETETKHFDVDVDVDVANDSWANNSRGRSPSDAGIVTEMDMESDPIIPFEEARNPDSDSSCETIPTKFEFESSEPNATSSKSPSQSLSPLETETKTRHDRESSTLDNGNGSTQQRVLVPTEDPNPPPLVNGKAPENPKQKQKRGPKHKKKTTKPKQAPKKTKKSAHDEELIRLALHRNPYFTCLDEEQIERFVDEAELVKDFRPGQAVIVEGPSRPRPSKAQLRKMRTNVGDVYGDDYFDNGNDNDSAEQHRASSWGVGNNNNNNSPSDIDDPWWVEDDDTVNDEYNLNEYNHNEYHSKDYTPHKHHHHHEDDAAAASRSSYLYIIRNGKADIFYETINPATLGPSRMFGEGGFLFGRNHSASVVAATDQLECFRIDRHTFVHKILPSQNMKRLYRKYSSSSITSTSTPTSASHGSEGTGPGDQGIKEEEEDDDDDDDGEEKFVMTMDDFLEFFKKERGEAGTSSSSSSSSSSSLTHPSLSPIANAYQSILRGTSSTYHDEKNHITLEDFCFFHFLMARPDPEVDIAFILMDRSRMGTITRKDFERYLETSVPYFAKDSEFVERHFGNGRVIRAHQFSQFLHDLQREMGRQAFLYRVREVATENHQQQQQEQHDPYTTATNTATTTNNNNNKGSVNMADPHIGYLTAETFIEVLKATSSWRLPDGVIDRLESLYCKPSIDSAESTALASVRAGTIKGDSPKQVAEYSRRSVLADLERRRNKLGTRHFAYVDFIAFQDLLVQLPAICNLIERSCQIKKGPISPDDFKVANRVLGIGGRLSRQQVNIVFDLFDLDHDGYLSNEDAISVCGLEIGSNVLEAVKGRDGKPTFAPPPNYPQVNDGGGFGYNDDAREWENMSMEEWMMNHSTQFLLSSIAGGFGIFTVYPLDLIKTRMMNQRLPGADGTRLYYTSLDCLQKVIRYEGFQSLYRGLLPPLLAAGPEKFVKFTVNDMLRGVLSKDDGSSTQWLTEIVSGGCAGACQLLVTNPLEIVKIRMQMQGETARIFQAKGFEVPRGLGLHYMSFTQIIQDFGMSGLYKGAAACLMRDIPFGAIYFPVYAACMDYLVNREGSAGASSSSILISGTLAAVPASLLTNPMDLVKTRLQVANRPGEEIYSGIGDCFRKIYQTEGPWAFFKGSFPRVARIAPQFGLSLFAYEKLSQLIGFRGIAPPTNAPVNPRDYRMAFSSVSSGIESKAIDAESLIENIGLFKPPR